MEEGLASVDMWLIRVVYIFGIIIAIFVWMAFMKRYYAKQVIGRIFAEFITAEGNGYTKLLICDGDKIIIPPKGDKPGRQFAVADVATHLVDYPAVPKMFSFIQTKAKKAIFFEECWEPISNRSGKLLLSPRRLYNLLNERFSQIGVEQAREEGASKPQSKSYNIPWKIIIILALILAAVAIGYFVVQNVDLSALAEPSA